MTDFELDLKSAAVLKRFEDQEVWVNWLNDGALGREVAENEEKTR